MIARRGLLKGAAALSGAALLPQSIKSALAQANRPFTYAGFGGSTLELEKKYLLEPAAKKIGKEMVYLSTSSNAKVQTMVETGQIEWDLVSTGPRFLLQGADRDLIEKLDPAIVDQSGLPERWRFDHGIVYISSTYVVAYNTDQFTDENAPKTWEDFWNVSKFPGARTMWKNLNQCYEVALRAAGVPREEVYPVTEEKIDIVFKKLNEIKPHVKVWWVNSGQPGQLLATGEVAIAMAMTGRLNATLKEGLPIKWTYADGLVTNVALCIPKGSPYAKEAMEVMAYILSDEAQSALLDAGLYGPAVQGVTAKATPEQLEHLSLSPKHMETSFFADYREMAKYLDNYEKRWLEFIAG